MKKRPLARGPKPDEKTFRLVVEAAPNAMIMAGEDGRIALVNAQAEKLFGYPRLELLGRPLELLVPERFRGKHAEHRRGFFAAPQARPMGAGRDLFGLRKDGREVPIEIGLNPIETPEGAFVLASIIDITERKKSEQQQREFVANVSHELRTPLAAISGSLQTLKSGGFEDRRHRADFVDIIGRQTLRLSELVERLLLLSALDSGLHGSPKRERVLLPSFVKRFTSALRPLARKKKLSINAEIAPGLMTSVAEEELHDILHNLCANAINYSAPKTRIVIEGRADGGRVLLSVQDQGIGISSDELPKVFDRFQRTKAARALKVEGTGLGLSIVKAIVESHGGSVWAESVEGQGSTFHVSLPSAAA